MYLSAKSINCTQILLMFVDSIKGTIFLVFQESRQFFFIQHLVLLQDENNSFRKNVFINLTDE